MKLRFTCLKNWNTVVKQLGLLLGFFAMAHFAKAQAIVETFEEAAFTSLAPAGNSGASATSNGTLAVTMYTANTTVGTSYTSKTQASTFSSLNQIVVTVNPTSNATSQNISTLKANASTCTSQVSTNVGESVGTWTWWVFGAAGIVQNANYNAGGGATSPHSVKTCARLTGGYLATPVITTGISQVTFWVYANSNYYVGLKSVFTGSSNFGAATYAGNMAAMPTVTSGASNTNPYNIYNMFSNNISCYAATSGAAGNVVQVTYTVPATLSSNALQLAFWQGGNGVSIDDIVITSGAASNTWTSVAASDWNTTTTWDKGTVPAAGSTVIVNTAVSSGSTFTYAPSTIKINSSGSLTINSAQTISAAITVGVGGTLATSVTLTSSGSILDSGTFKILQGGWATGGTWNYIGTQDTLTFANTSGPYGFNYNDVYWPATNSPANVTVLTGGLNFGNANGTSAATRTVSGLFQTGSQVEITSNTGTSVLTITGTCQINSGGYFSQGPTYSGSSSTLIYNNVGVYSNSVEWNGGGSTTPTVGIGIPGNVTLQGSTTNLTTAGPRGVPGTVTVSSGATLTLGNTSGYDLYVGTNFAMSGTFTPNSRAVFFVTTTAGAINSSLSYVTLAYLIINKSGSTLTLNAPVQISSPGTVTLTAGNIVTTATNTLTLLNTGTGAITSGSTSSYVNGPLIWTLPASLAAGTVYTYPVGTSSTYLPMGLNPVTGTGTVTATVTAVSGPTGGTAGLGIGTLATSEYWYLASTGNFTSCIVNLYQQTAVSPNTQICECSTLTGTYSPDGGTASGDQITGSNSTTGAAQYFVFGTPPSAPSVTTNAATSIGATTATLNASINPNGGSTTTSFNYGTTTGYGTNVAASPSPITTTQSVTASSTGLTPNTLYDFQGQGVNTGGTGTGSNASFTTLPNAPTVGTGSAATTTGFTANWTAPSPAGSANYGYTVQASTSTGFGSIAATETITSSASPATTYTFTTLSPATTYYYRVYATNTTGNSAASGTSAAITTLVTASTACTTGNGASGTPGIIADGTPASATDALWANAPANSINNVINGTGWAGSTWQAMFDATNLYVKVIVIDHTLAAGNASCTSGGTSYQYDGTDVYLDGANAKAAGTGMVNCSQSTYNRTCSGTNVAPTAGTNQVTSTYSSTTGTNTWTEFTTIPWANVAAMQNITSGSITALSTIGFDVDYNDDSVAGNRAYGRAWYATSGSTNYNTASTWGNAKLSVCAPPTVGSPTQTSITATSATLGATVSALNGGGTLPVGGSGVEYSTSATFASGNVVVPLATSPTVGTPFTISATGLSPQTLYYYEGYGTRNNFSTNVVGVSSSGNFYTLSNPATAGSFSWGTDTGCSSAILHWTGATFPGSGATSMGYILLRAVSPAVPSLSNGNGASPVIGTGTIISSSISSTATTYTDATVSAGTTYNYLLIPYCYNGTNAATYNYLTTLATTSLAVNASSVGGTAAATASSVCNGSNTTVTVSGYTGSIQWQDSSAATSGAWASVSGGSGPTLATYTLPNLYAGSYYRASVSNSGCSAAYSTSALVAVDTSNEYAYSIINGTSDLAAGLGNWTTTVTTGGAYPNTSGVACSTYGDAWGLYAGGATQGTNYVYATRAFNSNMSSGNTVTFTMNLGGGISTGGRVGCKLQTAGTYGTSATNLMEFFYQGNDVNDKFSLCYLGNTGHPNQVPITFAQGQAGLKVSIVYEGSNTFGISVYTLSNTLLYQNDGLTFENTGVPGQIALVNDGAGNGSTYDQFFNSLSLNGPVITAQSTATQTYNILTTPTNLTVTAYGSGITYQWQESSNGTTGWANVTNGTGGTTSSYTPQNTVPGTNYYQCIVTGACSAQAYSGVSGAVIVTSSNNTIVLSSATGTDGQTVCISSAITNITYNTTKATGATFSGLPPGVTGNWSDSVVTISGAPNTTTGSPFSYTIT